MKKMKISIALFSCFIICLLLGVQLTAKSADQKVHVIPIEDTVEKGLSKFIERSFEARQSRNGRSTSFSTSIHQVVQSMRRLK